MSEAFPYSVVQGAGESGRIAVASRPLSPGEIVLAERAIVCVAALGRDVCDDCLEPVRAGARCALCLGGDCGGGITPPGVCATDAVRLAAKLLWRRCSGFLEPGHELDVDGLVHHEELFARECGHDQEEDCAQMVKLAAGMAPGRSAAGSAAETARESGMRVLSDAMTCSRRTVVDPLKLAKQELGRVHVNAITMCDGSGATGLGLFPLAAMFNHSCSPNLQAWWRGSKLELRCTKAVATAEELCFSYISIDQPSKLRREQLRHGWFFTCFCQRCVSGKWDAELTGLRCPRASCAGAAPPPWEDSGASCNHCGCVIGAALAPEENQPLDQRRSVSSPSPSSAEAKRLRTEFAGDGGGGARERFLEARRDFDSGVRAYMREDAEAAFVALAKKSLVVQESLLHPFNKELLRTLRFASYAAVATSNWVEAHSFLVRWLHPMEVMFGAAEMWDIAIMRIDLGLVLDKLHPTNTSGASASPPSSAAATSSQRKPSPQETPSTQEKGNDEVHPDAIAELAQGLRWIWICLGKDSGLPAEGAALEACLTSRSRRLLLAAASVV